MSAAGAPSGGASVLWETYVRHFDFSQLGWLFQTFMNHAENDCVNTLEDVSKTIQAWLEHQWSQNLLNALDPTLLQKAMEGQVLPMNFVSFIYVLWHYTALHLEGEKFAGFDRDSIDSLQDIYDEHNTGPERDGLRGHALFAVLDDLGISFHTKEERQWYVETVKRLDTNNDGSIDFSELCQIVRAVVNMDLEKKRLREFQLVQQSGLPFDEVEDWNRIFQTSDGTGSGELEMMQVKDLISSIGVKWDNEFSHTLKAWMEEADENTNGTIDFGEFCLLIGRLWSANLNNIRGCARGCLATETVLSLRTVHGTLLSASEDGKVSALATSIGSEETLTMISLPSGNVTFKGAYGKFFNCQEEKVSCDAANGTQFKVTTNEDESIVLKASTSFGGTLYANSDGMVALSDGNPDDQPNFPLVMMKYDDMTKKCWSRMVRPARPAKINTDGRSRSKDKTLPPMPISPGLADCIKDIDNALDENKASARGR